MINPETFYDRYGREIGYRCSRCDRVVTKMWGNICNACRQKDQVRTAQVSEISALRAEVAALRAELDGGKV